MSDSLYPYNPFIPTTAAPELNLLRRGVPLQSMPGVVVPGANPAVATPGAITAPGPMTLPALTGPNLNTYLPGGGTGTARNRAIGNPYATIANGWNYPALARGWGQLGNWVGSLFAPSAQAAPAPGPGYRTGTGLGPYDQPAATGPSGPLLTPQATEMPLPQASVAKQAAAYRQATTAARQQLTADQLNAQSLAAANAGRTYLNPQLAQAYAIQGAAPGAAVNVTNALMPQGWAGTPAMQGAAIPAPPAPALSTGLPQSRTPAPGQSTPAQYTMLNMQGLY